MREFARVLPELAIDEEVWKTAYELAMRARARGLTVPATDVVIAACAKRHDADLEAADSDFDRLVTVGGPVRRAARRTGFSRGELSVPDDFDVMGCTEIETMFGEER